MNVGESTVTVGDHATLGPVRIELYQPQPPAPIKLERKDVSDQLLTIISQQQMTNLYLQLIYTHLTRPSFWRRLLNKVKQLCSMGR